MSLDCSLRVKLTLRDAPKIQNPRVVGFAAHVLAPRALRSVRLLDGCASLPSESRGQKPRSPRPVLPVKKSFDHP